jgi:hypothetical protein
VNIFVLDADPIKAAAYHCDKHVVKMILESGQMLCTAHWFAWRNTLNPPLIKGQRNMQEWLKAHVPLDKQPPWKMTHTGHPCTVWTQHTRENYRWHSELGLALCDEYRKRYGKDHKCLTTHRWLSANEPPSFETASGLTPFQICMPDDCKITGDPVASYQNYYREKKSRFAKWKYTQVPTWYDSTQEGPK